MTLDEVDIRNFGAVLMNKSIQPASIEQIYLWGTKALTPSFLGQRFKFVAIDVQLYFKGINESDVKSKISALINKAKESVVKFEDDFYYSGILSSTPQIENTLKKHTRKVTLSFLAYCYKEQITETVNRVTTKTINVAGNIDTPAIVEINPSINIIDLVINGLGESFTIKNLTAGQKVIISGESCTVIQGATNKFLDYDGWDFPKLQPGANTITFSKSSCDITVKYKPRFI